MGTKEIVLRNIDQERRKCAFENNDKLCPTAQIEDHPIETCLWCSTAFHLGKGAVELTMEAFDLNPEQAVILAINRKAIDPGTPLSPQDCLRRLNSLPSVYRDPIIEEVRK